MKTSFKIAIGATILMSIVCMVVSYGSMLDVAIAHRIHAFYAFPIAIDGTMCLAMFIRVYFSKIGKPMIAPMLIMAFFTATSIIVNAVAARDLLEAYLYSIAPIGVFACTELCAMIIEKSPVMKTPVRRSKNGQFAPKVIK